MKKKKIIIIALIVLALIIAGLLLYFLVFKEKNNDNKPKSKPTNNVTKKVTIIFDENGGKEIENLSIDKGTTTTLPTATKDGFTFIGWYKEDEIINEDYVFNEDTTLSAKWEELKKEDKLLKITFDSKGGSKVNTQSIKCINNVATIKNLPKSTKDAFNFLSWEDKNGKSITDGAKIVCDGELQLYAVWEYDGPVANPEQNKKDYTCKYGYELKDGNRCVKLANAERTCSSGMTYSSKANLCYSWYKNANTDNSCDSGYEYKTATDLGNAVSPGCYKIESATKKCPDGYTEYSVWGECALVEDAVLQ